MVDKAALQKRLGVYRKNQLDKPKNAKKRTLLDYGLNFLFITLIENCFGWKVCPLHFCETFYEPSAQ